MWSIYTKYLDQVNEVDKRYNEIHTHILGLK